MNTNMDAFQALLAGMPREFSGELPERCDRCDDLILTLEISPNDREAFNELYRSVHSLKVRARTHGLSIITTLCHQLENLISETDARRGFGEVFATRALAYVDLLRQVERVARPAQSGLFSHRNRAGGVAAVDSATPQGRPDCGVFHHDGRAVSEGSRGGCPCS